MTLLRQSLLFASCALAPGAYALLATPQAEQKPPSTESNPAPAAEALLRRPLTRGESQLIAPADFAAPAFQTRRFAGTRFSATLFARSFARGEVVYIELVPAGPAAALLAGASAELLWDERAAPLEKTRWGFRGFAGVAADDARLGKRFAIAWQDAGGAERREFLANFARTQWPVFRGRMDLGRFSDAAKPLTAEEQALIERATRKRLQVFALRTDLKLDARLSHPRDMHRITSPFWATRVTEQYRVQNNRRIQLPARTSIHRGLDFRAVTGANVFALARGQAVIAEQFFYEGKFTVLDHGHGILSLYMHQDEILIREGDLIEAGQLIGRAGATGAVTGAHLHVALLVRGAPVDPLSLLALPVRN